MHNPAATYADALHDIAALARLERFLASRIAEAKPGSAPRRDYIYALQRTIYHQRTLRTIAESCRKTLYRELSAPSRSLARELAPVTEAELRAMIAEAEASPDCREEPGPSREHEVLASALELFQVRIKPGCPVELTGGDVARN